MFNIETLLLLGRNGHISQDLVVLWESIGGRRITYLAIPYNMVTCGWEHLSLDCIVPESVKLSVDDMIWSKPD